MLSLARPAGRERILLATYRLIYAYKVEAATAMHGYKMCPSSRECTDRPHCRRAETVRMYFFNLYLGYVGHQRDSTEREI